MTETQKFFTAVLDLVPINSSCEIRTSNEELIKTISSLENSVVTNNYECNFLLTEHNKKILLISVREYHLEEYMHSFEVDYDGKTIFVAFDGFEIGTISSSINLPVNFIDDFVHAGICTIDNF
jgi:hypothetical protein